MGKLIDLTDMRFGRLTVIGREGTYQSYPGKTYTTWRCVCDCGNEIVVIGQNLRQGSTRSCGCLRKETAHFHARKIRKLGFFA
jgi:hypothetical protein